MDCNFSRSHPLSIHGWERGIGQKFLIIPIATAFILSFTDLSLFVQGIIFMEIMTPLPIANINLASLYDCKPKDMTSLILLSTLIFIPLLFGLSYIVNHYYLIPN